MQRFIKFVQFIAATLSLVLIGSCSGFFPASNEITSLTVSPPSGWITPTNTQQFTATAVLGNNNVSDVTSQVTWTSTAQNIATIDSSGLATGVALGVTTITAKSNNSSVTVSEPLTVANKTVSAVNITPSTVTLSASGAGYPTTQQLQASATFSDGSTGTVTTVAGWTASPPSIASVSSSGLVTAVSQGTATISATLGNVAGTVTVTVNQ